MTSPDKILEALHSPEEEGIERLRLVAFNTNAPGALAAYYQAASKWFQDRHLRNMEVEKALRRAELSRVPDDLREVAASILDKRVLGVDLRESLRTEISTALLSVREAERERCAAQANEEWLDGTPVAEIAAAIREGGAS